MSSIDVFSVTQRIIVAGPSSVRIVNAGPIGPPGVKGDPGEGIESNITRITASPIPPTDPEVNDLWIDLS